MKFIIVIFTILIVRQAFERPTVPTIISTKKLNMLSFLGQKSKILY